MGYGVQVNGRRGGMKSTFTWMIGMGRKEDEDHNGGRQVEEYVKDTSAVEIEGGGKMGK